MSDVPNVDKLTKVKRITYAVWAVIGVGIIFSVSIDVLGELLTPVAIILFSAFLVFILRVPVLWLERHRVPRAAGAAIAYVVALLVLAAFFLIFLPVLSEQIFGLADLLPGYVNTAVNFFTSLYNDYQNLIVDDTAQQVIVALGGELSKFVTTLATESASGLIQFTSSIANAFMVVFVSIVVGFWVLKDLPSISHEFVVLVGPRLQPDFQFIVNAFSHSLGGYLKSMIVAALCTGTMAGICYYFIGLPYPVVLGILTGLMNFIPFIGPWIAALFAALLGIFVSPLVAILAIVGTIVPQFVTDNFITPRVMSGNVSLHPSMVIIALMAGAVLGGVFGVLCAIPLTAAFKTIFVYYFERRTGRCLSLRSGALFKGKVTQPLEYPESSEPTEFPQSLESLQPSNSPMSPRESKSPVSSKSSKSPSVSEFSKTSNAFMASESTKVLKARSAKENAVSESTDKEITVANDISIENTASENFSSEDKCQALKETGDIINEEL